MENRPQGLPSRLRVVFLHEKLAKRKCDRYLLSLAQAYQHLGHRVTFYTSCYNRRECIEDIQFPEKIKIRYSAWWIPRSILGFLREEMSTLKALCMALRMVFYPKERRPNLVVLDINMVALYVLHLFSQYRLFYVQRFEQLRARNDLCDHVPYIPTLFEAKFIKLADEIIVESASFAEVFKKSFPAVTRDARVIYPAIDVGLWTQEGIQVKRIIPDLLDNTIMFLCIGKYRRSSNFKLALDAFELLLQILDDAETTKRFHLVIAGNCKTLDEKLHYNDILASAKERMCASQVSFLSQLPIIHEKTLLLEAAIVLFPSKNEVQADYVLKAMSLGKPIVATTRGVAARLLQNRVSGVTAEPEPHSVALVMKKLMMSPHLKSFLGEVAKDLFFKQYSFNSFCQRLSDLTYGKAFFNNVEVPSLGSILKNE